MTQTTAADTARIERPVVRPSRHFIAGEFVDSVSGETFDHVDPALGTVTTTAARGGREDVDRAVGVAREAFEDGRWSRRTPAQRREVLMRAAQLMDERLPELSLIESVEVGRPVSYMPLPGTEVRNSRFAWNFRFFAMEQETGGEESYNRDDTLLTYTMRDPAGVFGLITPWNGPLSQPSWHLAPCLAYGNSVVLKPSENSPLSIGHLAELLTEAGLPEGVFNIVQGFGHEAGAALVEDPRVTGISFTGSPGTARQIARSAADNFTRTSFELGGKSACLIFADADLEAAVAAAARSIFAMAGQACVANSRVLVERSVLDQVADLFCKEAERWRPADPFLLSTTLGPVASKAQFERVHRYLDICAREGEVIAGGASASVPSGGYYVAPTVVVDLPAASAAAREEIFGPVVALSAFDTADDAIAMANDSDYGLAGYVWTDSQTTAHYVTHRLQTGMIWINSGFDRDLRQPFGGLKQSGLGREGAGHSREFFTETRFAAFPLTPRTRAW